MYTPLDIENKKFAKQMMNGYSVEEVDNFLDELTLDYEKLYKESSDNKSRIAELEANLVKYKNLESTLQNTLVMAQTTADEIKRGLDLANSRDIARGAYKEGAIDKEFFFPRVWDRNKIADFLLDLGTSSVSAAKKILKDRVKKALIEGLESDQVYNRKMFEVYQREMMKGVPKSKSTGVAVSKDTKSTISGSTEVSTKRGTAGVQQELDITSPDYKAWVEKQADNTAMGIVDQGEGLRRNTFDRFLLR